MTTRTAKLGAAEEIAAIEELVSDLEKRLRRLSGSARNEAAGASERRRRLRQRNPRHHHGAGARKRVQYGPNGRR